MTILLISEVPTVGGVDHFPAGPAEEAAIPWHGESCL